MVGSSSWENERELKRGPKVRYVRCRAHHRSRYSRQDDDSRLRMKRERRAAAVLGEAATGSTVTGTQRIRIGGPIAHTQLIRLIWREREKIKCFGE